MVAPGESARLRKVPAFGPSPVWWHASFRYAPLRVSPRRYLPGTAWKDVQDDQRDELGKTDRSNSSSRPLCWRTDLKIDLRACMPRQRYRISLFCIGRHRSTLEPCRHENARGANAIAAKNVIKGTMGMATHVPILRIAHFSPRPSRRVTLPAN